MSWEYEIPTCLHCKHSDQHIQLMNFPKNDYPYYTWGCTHLGCECVISNLKDIRKWNSYRKERRENNVKPVCFECGHNDEHREGVCYPKNEYPYYIWSCTYFGCNCTITDKGLIL